MYFMYVCVCMYVQYVCMYVLCVDVHERIALKTALYRFSLEGLAAGLVLLSRGVHPQPQPLLIDCQVRSDWEPCNCP